MKIATHCPIYCRSLLALTIDISVCVDAEFLTCFEVFAQHSSVKRTMDLVSSAQLAIGEFPHGQNTLVKSKNSLFEFLTEKSLFMKFVSPCFDVLNNAKIVALA